jgi:predicted PurR-regulated permease PerM
MAGMTERARDALDHRDMPTGGVPHWLWTLGLSSWLAAGVIGAIVLVLAFISASATISVPLIVAVVVGAIAAPLVEAMSKRGVPKALAATIVLVGLILIIAVTLWVTVAGVMSQGSHIQAQLQSGLDALRQWLAGFGIEVPSLKSLLSKQSTETAQKAASSGVLSSVGSAVSTGLSSAFALFFGIFISFALMFYVLSDFGSIAGWIGRHLGLPPELGEGIVRDAVDSLRGYFKGTTLSGLAVALVIGIAVWALGVPLAIPIALVTFLTCYIPFFGAIISGAFACLIALGASGPTKAVIVLVVVLVAQNLLQTVINAKTMGDSLALAPLVILVVTMLGGIFGGLLGTVLAAPLTALGVRAGNRLSAARAAEIEGASRTPKPLGAPDGA